MKTLAIVILALLAAPAQAQLQKCVDERGRVHYTDKPIPGCKPTAQQPTPAATPPAAVKKDAPKPVAKAPGKAAKAPPEPPPSVSECKAAEEQYEWLRSDRGKDVEMRETRIAQVRQMMAKCR